MGKDDKKDLLRATHQGKIHLGDVEIDVAVLEDGTRVVNRAGMFKAFGRQYRGTTLARRSDLPSFIASKRLEPYISAELRHELTGFTYLRKSGAEAQGFRAEIIPLVADVYLRANDDDALQQQQKPLAKASEILVRSLSKLGIVALIDEGTGYQADRQKDELQKILEAYISAELLPWQKRFPNEFYQQICRLKGWGYDPLTQKRPQIIGKITNDIVYKLLPPGVLDELRSKNPKNESGNRTYKHHQFLTEEVGNQHLDRHLHQLIILMRISKDWTDFEEKLFEAFPTIGRQLKMELDELPENDERLKEFLRNGGRTGAKSDFDRIVNKASKK